MTISLTGLRPRNRPPTPARGLPTPLTDFFATRLQAAQASLAEPFKGITTDGQVVPGLFPIRATGVSTQPIVDAAEALLAALGAEQREQVLFPVDSEAWRQWSNIHPYLMRHGLLLDDLSSDQRERALGLLRSGLSARGYETARNVMRLNYTIGEITGRLGDEYGEWLYWLSLMGRPSPDGPWGWQRDGHHLIVNAFLLGDQLVLTPLFMGSEPVFAAGGKYAGTRVFEAEERDGLAFMRSLTTEQRRAATLGLELPIELFTAAFRDNFEMRYEGIRYDALSAEQRDRLLGLIEIYVGRTRPGHAEVKLAEVKEHLAETYFAWIGECEEDSVFYYRIHSPVILIEFDHQRGIALYNDAPMRTLIHT